MMMNGGPFPEEEKLGRLLYDAPAMSVMALGGAVKECFVFHFLIDLGVNFLFLICIGSVVDHSI